MKTYVSDDGLTLVTDWGNGTIQLATRASLDDVWGPPTILRLERS